jgi:hypothetical protein
MNLISKTIVSSFLLLTSNAMFAQEINSLTKKEEKEGWELLFDGKTTNGWRGANSSTFPTATPGWVVNNGILTIQSTDGSESQHAGDIVSLKEYSAFELSFDFKLTKGANSGVKYFVTGKEKSKASAIGLEFQILDDEVHPDAKLGRNGNRTLGSL